MSATAASARLGSVLIGSVTARSRELTEADAVLRAPLSLSRRIGFVQLRGGSGASAAAGYVASLLARRRAGMVLGVNASGGDASMLWHAGTPAPAAVVDSDLIRRAHPVRAADARAGLPVTATGLHGLDLAQGRVAAAAGSWFEQVGPIARFFDIVVTDWGVRHRDFDLAQAVAASHVVCVVARADRHAAEQAAALIPALQGLQDAPQVVLALVDLGRTAERTAELLRRQVPAPVITIPYEPARGSARPLPSRRLPDRTRLAHIRLARTLMSDLAPRPAATTVPAPNERGLL